MNAVIARLREHVKIDPKTSCWIWTRARTGHGYANVWDQQRKKLRLGHRVAYEAVHGPIPEGLVLDHVVCDTPPCINPDHVKPVIERLNILRGNSASARNSRRTHCRKGHRYDKRWKKGERFVRACSRCNAGRIRRRRHDDPAFKRRQDASRARSIAKLSGQERRRRQAGYDATYRAKRAAR